ncbi:MAG: Tetratricopeptide repeat protein [bacterium ADurb.Bin363]|nr:MAG: Tetratricopeptide repeat protein [bacterium ADurb.Bin363]
MDKEESFFCRLRELLERFDTTFKVDTVKSCGNCYYCCTPVTHYPWLYPLEKDFIDTYIDKTSTLVSLMEFQDFLLYTSYSVCPFYKIGTGCGIYTFRPLFCRIFGPIDTGKTVPHFCIYYNLKERIPFSEIKEFLYEYKLLNLDYTRYKLSYCQNKDEEFFLLLELGLEYMLLYEFSKAFNIFTRALELRPEDYSVYYNLGWVCFEIKSFHEAINYFTKALEFGAGEKNYFTAYEKLAYFNIYEKIACTYTSLSQFDCAEEFYNKALKVNSGNIVCHTGLLIIYYRAGRIEEFNRRLKRLLVRFPEDETVQKFASLARDYFIFL